MATKGEDIGSEIEKFEDISHLIKKMKEGASKLSFSYLGNINPSQMAELSKAIADNKNLREVEILAGRFGPEIMQDLAKGLKNCTLTNLTLSGTLVMSLQKTGKSFEWGQVAEVEGQTLDVMNAWMKSFAEIVQDHPSLTTLTINEGYGIPSQSMEYLEKALSDHPSLQELSFHTTPIGPKGMMMLARALQGNTRLTTLNLEGSQISSEGVQYLSKMLQDNATLKKLNLSANGIDDKGMDKFAQVLGGQLESLTFEDNKLSSVGVQKFSDALAQSNLKHLKFTNRNGQEFGHLGKAIAQNKTLVEMDLSRSRLGQPSEMQEFISGLSSNRTLKKLNLQDCYIRDPDLIKQLVVSNNLEDLDLSVNPLLIAGVNAAVQALANSKLKHLHVGRSDEHLTMLAADQNTHTLLIQAMQNNTSLLQNPVGDWGLPEAQKTQINSFFERNQALLARNQALAETEAVLAAFEAIEEGLQQMAEPGTRHKPGFSAIRAVLPGYLSQHAMTQQDKKEAAAAEAKKEADKQAQTKSSDRKDDKDKPSGGGVPGL